MGATERTTYKKTMLHIKQNTICNHYNKQVNKDEREKFIEPVNKQIQEHVITPTHKISKSLPNLKPLTVIYK